MQQILDPYLQARLQEIDVSGKLEEKKLQRKILAIRAKILKNRTILKKTASVSK
ncbi:MAG TPA: hypothetical protein VLG47_01145 [Candidatus Saccharimonadales bacterium]|nr:hypothetical protein [Candidatus Saccharimonadales bacterium]